MNRGMLDISVKEPRNGIYQEVFFFFDKELEAINENRIMSPDEWG